jgi:hypothetical protein
MDAEELFYNDVVPEIAKMRSFQQVCSTDDAFSIVFMRCEKSLGYGLGYILGDVANSPDAYLKKLQSKDLRQSQEAPGTQPEGLGTRTQKGACPSSTLT